MHTKTKYRLFLLIFITLLILISYSQLSSQYTNLQGEHSVLLKEAYLKDNQFKTSNFYSYCKKNNLNPSYLFVYEVHYDIKKIGNKSNNSSLYTIPIISSSLNSSILAIKSNIPIRINNNSDSQWFYTTTKANLETLVNSKTNLKVTYLIDINKANYIPQNLNVDKLKNIAIKSDFSSNKKNKIIIDLSKEIYYSLPKSDQNSLRSVVNAYVSWISENIAYPFNEKERDLIRGKYINLNNPLTTLDLKIGVCDDNSLLLQSLLEAQGIQSQRVNTLFPRSLEQGYVSPKEYIGHSIIAIRDGNKAYFIDPTGQTNTLSKNLKLPNNMNITVSTLPKGNEVKIFPTLFIDLEAKYKENEIVDYSLNHDYSFNITKVNTVKLK